MKSKLSRATVLATAAIAVGALASPVMAKTLEFTFGIAGGGAHCDGLTLTQVKNPPENLSYGGTHTGCTNNDPAGGYAVRVNRGNNLDIATTNTTISPNAWTFFLNLESNEWFLYEIGGGVFQQIDSGPLIAGPPPPKARVGAKPAGSPNPKGTLDRMF
jgi:hypothetical protein